MFWSTLKLKIKKIFSFNLSKDELDFLEKKDKDKKILRNSPLSILSPDINGYSSIYNDTNEYVTNLKIIDEKHNIIKKINLLPPKKGFDIKLKNKKYYIHYFIKNKSVCQIVEDFELSKIYKSKGKII